MDSGPIIKGGDQFREAMRGAAHKYVTVPSVLDEIRDSKSRHSFMTQINAMWLQHQQQDGSNCNSGSGNGNGLIIRDCTASSLQTVIQFSKQTGDYASLSHVDLQVLALTLDMELEGCCGALGGVGSGVGGVGGVVSGNSRLGHIRTTPKRTIGLGSIRPMRQQQQKNGCCDDNNDDGTTAVPLRGETKGDDDDSPAAGLVDTATAAVVAETKGRDDRRPPSSILPTLEYDVVVESDEDEEDDDKDDDDDDDEDDEDEDEEEGGGEQRQRELHSFDGTPSITKPVQTTPHTQHLLHPHFQARTLTTSAPAATRSWAALLVSPTTATTTTTTAATAAGAAATAAAATSTEPTVTSAYPPHAAVGPAVANGGGTADANLRTSFASMAVVGGSGSGSGVETETTPPTSTTLVGQFDDASDDGDDDCHQREEPGTTATAGADLPPPSTITNTTAAMMATTTTTITTTTTMLQQDIDLHFPALQAVAAGFYEGGGDDDDDDDDVDDGPDTDNDVDASHHPPHKSSTQATDLRPCRDEEGKFEALKPISRSGKQYNSFRKYKDLMKPKRAAVAVRTKKDHAHDEETTTGDNVRRQALPQEREDAEGAKKSESKISGGGVVTSEVMKIDDDDGEGWIKSVKEIRASKMHNGGMLDPSKAGSAIGGGSIGDAAAVADTKTAKIDGPPLSQRAACTTTDFAMQNVLLQMNLLLLSVDGMRIRRLKSWVIRCGACFKIHSTDDDFNNGLMRRLFCSHCGSGDMLQRIAASVDGTTGRLKLHFSKRKQGKHLSTRGTKFSLPKAGSGDRFQGDLLLREDQLLVGVWNQKVKIRSGGSSRASAESMFGNDLASNVGCCKLNSMTAADDIRVGFGARKNPNASKGRERRGKKKKSSDRACGLRRY